MHILSVAQNLALTLLLRLHRRVVADKKRTWIKPCVGAASRSMPSPMRSSRMHRPSHQMQFLAGGQASCAHLIGLNIRRRLDHRHHHCRHLLLSLLLSLHLRRLRRLHRHDRAGQGIIFTCRTCHQMDHRHKRPHTSPLHLLHHRPQDPPSIRSWQFINKHHGSGRQNRLTSVKQQRSRVNFGFRPWYSP